MVHHSLSSAPLEKNAPAWVVEQEPTTLIGFWSGAAPPALSQVLVALQQYSGHELVQIDELDNHDVLWNGVFKTRLIEQPIVIWAEPAKPLSPDELNDSQAEACKWVVGLETLLNPDSPLDEYTALLRALAGGLNCTTILDPITHRYWQSQALTDLIATSPSELSPSDLWTSHAVQWRDKSKSEGAMWLHTHGLRRCGCPELEMLEVPHIQVDAAMSLLNEIAMFALDEGLARPNELMELGPELVVTAQHWEEVTSNVNQENSGGINDRQGEDNPHAGVSAVICASQPKGQFRKAWVWPEEVVQRFQQSDAVLYRTSERTARQAQLARKGWADLAKAFEATRSCGAKLNQPSCVFLIKDALANSNDSSHNEHVWFEVICFDGDDLAQARLVSRPRDGRGLVGDMMQVSRATISDWMVQTPLGQFGPADVPAMWRALRQFGGK